MEKKQILTSGTLGDFYIILNKVTKVYPDVLIELVRVKDTRVENFEKQISDLLEDYPKITLINSNKTFSCEKELVEIIKESDLPYVNPWWGCWAKLSKFQDTINTIQVTESKSKTKKIIGFQVHSGKSPGNFKHFDVDWIKDVSIKLTQQDFKVIFLGTDEQLKREVSKFVQTKQLSKNTENKIGRLEFNSWRQEILKCDCVITPEGFPAFYASNNKVKTVCFYTDKNSIKRVDPHWLKNSIFLDDFNRNFLHKLYYRTFKLLFKVAPPMSPIEPQHLVQIVRIFVHGKNTNH